MKPSQTLVIYKDGPKAQTLVFGPFINDSIASDFLSDLPEPLKGGFKRCKVTQPFTVHETNMVKNLILRHRA